MAVTVSGFLIPTWIDLLDATQLAVDLDLETHKLAFFTNTITPNFTTDTAYGVAPYDANEVSDGGNWPAGGVAITGTTWLATDAYQPDWDATDMSVASTTLTNIRAGLVYADALAGNNGIILIDFNADYSTVAGTIQVTWDTPANGAIFYLDLTPA